MDVTSKQEEQEWYKEHLDKFSEILPSYQIYARVLRTMLDKAAKRYTPATIIEDANISFAKIEDGLKRYATSYGAYMTEEQIGEK